MKITCAFYRDASQPEDEMPTLLVAYDSFTEDAWNGTPDFYTEDIKKCVEQGGIVRECTFAISDNFVDGLFAIPETDVKNPQPKLDTE